ncbi:cytochrome P450 [Tanacetum coccineum]
MWWDPKMREVVVILKQGCSMISFQGPVSSIFHLGGRRFTRFDKDGRKASKLDRFLVSSNFFDVWNDASVSVLCRSFSDHCPLLIKAGAMNSGLKPFKVFNKLLIVPEYRELVASIWVEPSPAITPDIGIKNKLKKLRMAIKK